MSGKYPFGEEGRCTAPSKEGGLDRDIISVSQPGATAYTMTAFQPHPMRTPKSDGRCPPASAWAAALTVCHAPHFAMLDRLVQTASRLGADAHCFRFFVMLTSAAEARHFETEYPASARLVTLLDFEASLGAIAHTNYRAHHFWGIYS